jgi:hypothetical protein
MGSVEFQEVNCPFSRGLRKKALCVYLFWDRLPVFLVLSARPVPDDPPCNSIRDTTGRLRSYKWLQQVQRAQFCQLASSLIAFSPLCPGNHSNWTLLHSASIIRDWRQPQTSLEFYCQALWLQLHYQREYKCYFSCPCSRIPTALHKRTILMLNCVALKTKCPHCPLILIFDPPWTQGSWIFR